MDDDAAAAAAIARKSTNTPPHRGLRAAVGWTLGGDSASKAAVLLLNLLAARQLEPTDFALYVGVLATALLGSAFWDFGVSTLVSVEIAKRSAPVTRVLRRALILRLRTLPVWVLAFALGIATVGRSSPVSAAVFVMFALASALSSIQLPVLAALRARMSFREATLASAAGRWTTTGLAMVFLGTGSNEPLFILSVAHATGEAVTTVIGFLLLRPWSTQSRTGNWDPSRITAKAALPYASNSVIVVAYNRLDVVIVSLLTSASQFAAYAPASRMQDALYLLPGSLSVVAIPMLARYATGRDPARHIAGLVRKLWIGGLALAIPASVVLFILMPQIISLLLGSAYAGSATPTRILMWSMVLAVVGAPLLGVLIALDRGGDTTRAFAAALCVSLVLHCGLDWWLGAVGAAIASTSRDAANLLVAAFYVRQALRRLGASGSEVPPEQTSGLSSAPEKEPILE